MEWADRLRRTYEWHNISIVIASALGAVMFTALLAIGQGRMALAGSVAMLLVGGAVRHPVIAITGTFAYLTILGDLRRILIPLFGWSGSDPLLLIGAGMAVLLVAAALASRSLRFDSWLARGVLLLVAIMAVQIFNPKQGDLKVGIAGALFYIVPLLWFWVGQVYVKPADLRQMFLKIVLPLALIGSVFGIYQAFYGWLDYQMEWHELTGYAALMVTDTVMHPIGFFVSAEEYYFYLCAGVIIAWAYYLRQSPTLLILAPVLLTGVILSGSRTPVIFVVFAATALWAVQGRVSSWVPRVAFALVVGVAGMIWSLQMIDIGGETQSLVERQVRGLSDPFGEASTGGSHVFLFVSGIKGGFQEPLGHGLGATTLAAAKYGSESLGTERDISNLFVSLGALGGLFYVLLMGVAFWTVFRLWIQMRTFEVLVILGIMIVMLGQWLDGGLYALSPLVWLGLGVADRMYQEVET